MGETVAFVAGGGRFGTKALDYLKDKKAKIIIVDQDPNCRARSRTDILATEINILSSLEEGQAAFIVGDAVNFLMKTFKTTIPNLVVPAIPGHFAAFVVYNQLKNSGFNVAPYSNGINQVVNNLPEDLISPVDRECAVLIASYMPAGGRCDENCSSPPDFCSVTRRPKPDPMFKLLEFSVFELMDFSKILISKQLSPGVGAIDGVDLYELLRRLKNLHESNTLAIGTACNCHGILNLFNIS